MRILILAALLAGCVGPDLDSPPRVELGTGEVAFEPVADGDSLPLNQGLQGGQHVWGAARVVGIDWREIQLVFTVEDAAGAPLTEATTLFTELQPCDASTAGCASGMGEIVGVTVLIQSDDAPSVVGGNVSLHLEASDSEGRAAEDRRTIQVTYAR